MPKKIAHASASILWTLHLDGDIVEKGQTANALSTLRQRLMDRGVDLPNLSQHITHLANNGDIARKAVGRRSVAFRLRFDPAVEGIPNPFDKAMPKRTPAPDQTPTASAETKLSVGAKLELVQELLASIQADLEPLRHI